MYKVTLKEMIAIVNNGAHPYKVTLSVIGDEGTLVAASMNTNNVYTTYIGRVVCKGQVYEGKCLVTKEDWAAVPDYIDPPRAYTNGELVIFVKAGTDMVSSVWNCKTHNVWRVSGRYVEHFN